MMSKFVPLDPSGCRARISFATDHTKSCLTVCAVCHAALRLMTYMVLCGSVKPKGAVWPGRARRSQVQLGQTLCSEVKDSCEEARHLPVSQARL